MLDTPIIQLIDRDPVSVDVSQKMSDAFRILTSGRFHHLPVLEGGVLVGVLSTADVLEVGAASFAGDGEASLAFIDRHYQLCDVMKRDVITISHRATVQDAASRLSAGGFHSLPVVDQDNRLVGIATTTDLVRHLLDAMPAAPVQAAGRGRLQALEQVYDAAQAYLRTGMGAQELRRLESALEAARDDETPVSL